MKKGKEKVCSHWLRSQLNKHLSQQSCSKMIIDNYLAPKENKQKMRTIRSPDNILLWLKRVAQKNSFFTF